MFSILTSKIFGGASIALVLALGYVTVTKNAEISSLEEEVAAITKERDVFKIDLATARGNNATLEAGLTTCNNSVLAAAESAERAARASSVALAAVARNDVAVANAISSINAAPAETCEDAVSILRGEAG